MSPYPLRFPRSIPPLFVIRFERTTTTNKITNRTTLYLIIACGNHCCFIEIKMSRTHWHIHTHTHTNSLTHAHTVNSFWSTTTSSSDNNETKTQQQQQQCCQSSPVLYVQCRYYIYIYIVDAVDIRTHSHITAADIRWRSISRQRDDNRGRDNSNNKKKKKKTESVRQSCCCWTTTTKGANRSSPRWRCRRVGIACASSVLCCVSFHILYTSSRYYTAASGARRERIGAKILYVYREKTGGGCESTRRSSYNI